ncbi:MAG: TIGR00268 family protein, partial [Actinomycetota bacterium]
MIDSEPATAAAEQRLRETIETIGPLIVAFSGGVDSALLALAAHRVLGDDMVAVTAQSASLADGELDHCRSLTDRHQIPWQTVDTDELNDPRYQANAGDRCFWCKSALMDQLIPVAEAKGATITLGVNLDDLGDHRPGQEAAAERGARFPLVEAGLD